jgi:hypothetical protein
MTYLRLKHPTKVVTNIHHHGGRRAIPGAKRKNHPAYIGCRTNEKIPAVTSPSFLKPVAGTLAVAI